MPQGCAGSDGPRVHERIRLEADVFIAKTTWNSSSLFGSMSSARPRLSSTRQYSATLLEGSSMVGCWRRGRTEDDVHVLPETHGYFGSFAERAGLASSRYGGIFLAVRRRLLDRAPEVATGVHMRGRTMTLSSHADGWILFTLLANVWG